MQAIKPYTQIYKDFDGQKVLQKIEAAARTCYKSEGKIQEGSAAKLVAGLIKSGHEAMLEHASVTVKFVVDRGISHELVRHRLASFAQESTRYCNYSKDDFGSEITFIIPDYLEYKSEGWNIWKESMKQAEDAYFKMLDFGLSPQQARAVLPNSLKTEVVMTANLREWRHFFKLRLDKKAHPQMREVAGLIYKKFCKAMPVFFNSLDVDYEDEPTETQ